MPVTPPADTALPSGRQHTISHGDQTAVVTEVGATLRHYQASGRAVLDGFAADARADGGRGQVLAPWPNRVRDGRWTIEGHEQQLALSEAAQRNAIHGLVRWVGWSTTRETPDTVTLSTTVWPQPGYPFHLALTATYRLDDAGLQVDLEARNIGPGTAPYGVGQHPYLSAAVAADDALVDDLHLTLPARTRLQLDDRGIPLGREPVENTAYDFRSPRRIGDLVLDDGYGDLLPDDDGRVRVRLEVPGGSGAELWAEGATRWLQLFSGDTLDAARRRRGLAVEPMSCPPDALRTGEDLVLLAADQTHLLSWGIRAW